MFTNDHELVLIQINHYASVCATLLMELKGNCVSLTDTLAIKQYNHLLKSILMPVVYLKYTELFFKV